ncbi:glycosyltransferase family 2 protein [Nitratidesulfovibrio sp. 1201_IL3209]|uniref:glycosyltransferase family 2 protein n=1 Tax=Nitratidesulfovibrio sp. 1201_IL3209 TaxID=3084053 RepID=UPI002FDB1A62
MRTPRISVVVANHDYGRFLDRFFGALAAQTFPPDAVEVVFVDDASSDDSRERALRWQADGPWAAFRVLALPRVGRPGPVRNAGAEVARGPFLLFCDPDDYLAPDFLRRTHAALTEPDEPDGIASAPPGPHALRDLAHAALLAAGAEDGSLPDDLPTVIPSPGVVRPHIACTDYVEESPTGSRVVRVPDFHPDLLRTQNLFHTTSLMRREVWLASRGFRAATAYEDWDFWVQAAMAGFGVARVAEPLLHYVFHDANYSLAARADDGRAKARIVRDNPAFFESEVRAWARALLRGEPWAAPFGRGIIPRAADIRALRELFVARMGAARAGEIFARAGL